MLLVVMDTVLRLCLNVLLSMNIHATVGDIEKVVQVGYEEKGPSSSSEPRW